VLFDFRLGLLWLYVVTFVCVFRLVNESYTIALWSTCYYFSARARVGTSWVWGAWKCPC